MQEAKRRCNCFPKGVSKGDRVGERVSGWGAGGNSANPRLPEMARWVWVSLLTLGFSFPECKRTGMISQMPPVWGQSWQTENVGQRAEVACDHHRLFKILPVGSSFFLRQRWPRAGRPCNLNRTGDTGGGVEAVISLKLTSATYGLPGLQQIAPPLPAFPGLRTH